MGNTDIQGALHQQDGELYLQIGETVNRDSPQKNGAIITKDEDFAERCLYSRDQPVIVWLRIGNTSNQALLRWFVPLWPEIMRRIELGDRLIEVS